MNKNIELIYVMDPHCGWCFGFGKVILKLFENYKNNLSVSFNVKPGGLFFPLIKIPEGFAEDKLPIAQRIEELSGVLFSESYFTNTLGSGSFLDSEPPARAILCVKTIHKKLLVPFTERLLEKEFIYGKNNSFDETIFETIKEFDIDETEFKKCYHSTVMKQKVLLEFKEVSSMTTGFPVLFMKHNDQITKLAGGYAPTERLIDKIETLLN